MIKNKEEKTVTMDIWVFLLMALGIIVLTIAAIIGWTTVYKNNMNRKVIKETVTVSVQKCIWDNSDYTIDIG